ncbi:MAG TPA: carbohydrate ABC transporter permease [Clostridiales bacterium]|nr:carbohydrate ABC transporter permease [Clostridiales bacterium]
MIAKVGKLEIVRSSHVKFKIASALWWIVRFIIIFGLGFIILKPIIGKILLSFMNPDDLLDNTVKLYPKTPSTYYWRFALNNLYLPKSFINTLVLSLSIGLIQVASSTSIGYGLARFKFRGRGIAFIFVIIIMLVPYQVISIAQYLGFVYFGIGPFKVNLSDTFIPLYILAFTGLGVKEGLYIYLMRENFRSLPADLEDASYIDGAGVIRTFFQIMIPNARTMMITVFLFSFCWQWTDTTYSSLYLMDVKILSNVVQELYVRHGVFYDTMGTIIARSAASIFVMLPLLGLFGVCQRTFVKSIARAGLSNV